MKVVLLLSMLLPVCRAQESFSIPFASKGNILNVVVFNSAPFTVSGVEAQISKAPAWARFAEREVSIPRLSGKTEESVRFMFSVEKTAPVAQTGIVTVALTASDGQSWSKQIALSVAAPESFELQQNYPNPFNPTTVIGYRLPVESRVSLKIFNIIGELVATTIAEEQPAGYHESIWDASAFAAGIYVYQLTATSGWENPMVARKTMVVLK